MLLTQIRKQHSSFILPPMAKRTAIITNMAKWHWRTVSITLAGRKMHDPQTMRSSFQSFHLLMKYAYTRAAPGVVFMECKDGKTTVDATPESPVITRDGEGHCANRWI